MSISCGGQTANTCPKVFSRCRLERAVSPVSHNRFIAVFSTRTTTRTSNQGNFRCLIVLRSTCCWQMSPIFLTFQHVFSFTLLLSRFPLKSGMFNNSIIKCKYFQPAPRFQLWIAPVRETVLFSFSYFRNIYKLIKNTKYLILKNVIWRNILKIVIIWQ